MRSLAATFPSVVLLGVVLASGQQRDAGDMVARIRTEGLQRSRALALYRTLTDEIGARLTGSPAHMQAARWALDRFTEWGLANPHLEPYEFGRGWQLERVSVEMTAPRYVPLIAYADAWSPSTAGVVTGRVVYVGDKTAAQIQAMAGTASRRHRADAPSADRVRRLATGRSPVSTIARWPRATRRCAQARSTTPANELMPLLRRAGAAVALRPSAYRDGTVGVTGNRATPSDAVPSIVVAGEQYNVLARLAGPGTSGVAARRAADALLRGGSEQLQRHRRDPGTGPGAARSRSCSLARTSTRGTPRAAPPTTRMARWP